MNSVVYNLPPVSLQFNWPSLNLSGVVSFILAGIFSYFVVRETRSHLSLEQESQTAAPPDLQRRQEPALSGRGVVFNDKEEESQFQSLLQVQGGPIVMMRLEERYGRGFTNDDIDILKAFLLNGRKTPQQIAIFLNVPPHQVLMRIGFMERKGFLGLARS
jgi:hypothetical protein